MSQAEPAIALRRSGLVDSRYVGALVATAWLAPILATVVTVAAYTAPKPYPPPPFDLFHQYPVPAGVVTALVLWLLLCVGYAPFATARGVNVNSFGDLVLRLSQLNVRLETWQVGCSDGPSASACREARAKRDVIVSDLQRGGVRWVLATGYATVWKDLHRAEEALLTVAPISVLLGEALYDEWRLTGSRIDQHDNLLGLVQRARQAIEAPGIGGTLAPGKSDLVAGPAPIVVGAASTSEALSIEALKDIRTIIARVRRAINEFRDGRWSALIRARNLLIGSLLLTELFAIALLFMVLTVQPPIASVSAALIFFLVGAVVGLFNRLSRQDAAGTTIDDYSLSMTRLIATPVFSGLAAVGGVLLTAMITMSGLTSLAGTATTNSTVTIPPLMDIFNLDKFRLGLPLAALFGWAPALFVGRLQQWTDQYKADLKSSQPASDTTATPARA
jgi:hypothetical protein